MVCLCLQEENPVATLYTIKQAYLFTTAESVTIHSRLKYNNTKASREKILFFDFLGWLETRNENRKAQTCIMARGYTLICVWLCEQARMSVFFLFYLWVQTEGFGRFPNTEQVEYDLLHGKIQSLLNSERKYTIVVWGSTYIWYILPHWDIFIIELIVLIKKIKRQTSFLYLSHNILYLGSTQLLNSIYCMLGDSSIHKALKNPLCFSCPLT